jgi:hypothetical protein
VEKIKQTVTHTFQSEQETRRVYKVKDSRALPEPLPSKGDERMDDDKQRPQPPSKPEHRKVVQL